jgi:hypothetical protein
MILSRRAIRLDNHTLEPTTGWRPPTKLDAVGERAYNDLLNRQADRRHDLVGHLAPGSHIENGYPTKQTATLTTGG